MKYYEAYMLRGRIEELEFALRTFTLNAQAQSIIHKRLGEFEDRVRKLRVSVPRPQPDPATPEQLAQRALRAKRRLALEDRIAGAREALFVSPEGSVVGKIINIGEEPNES